MQRRDFTQPSPDHLARLDRKQTLSPVGSYRALTELDSAHNGNRSKPVLRTRVILW